MRRLLPVLVLLALGLAASGAQEAFDIVQYHIDMEVRENNSYEVTETLRVFFREERRGIIRDLPLYFDRRPVKVRSVSVPGREHKVSSDGRVMSIRIGSPDVYLRGEQVYTIKYVYDVGRDGLKDMDEFNHNLIGTEWATTIHRASFDIRLPKPFKPEDVNCTSGPYGSTDSSGVRWTVDGQRITGRMTQSLGPNEGLTIALPLPEGYWSGAAWHLPSVRALVSGYPLYVVVVLLAGFAWWAKGRAAKLYPSVQFEPPEGMTPAELGYVIDGFADTEDVTALVPYWADAGALRIEDPGKDAGGLRLVRVGELGPEAKPYERRMFDSLFSYGKDGVVNVSELSFKFHTALDQAKYSVETSFSSDPERRVFEPRKATLRLGSMEFSLAFLMGVLGYLPLLFLSLELGRAITGEGPVVFAFLFVSLFLLVLPFNTLSALFCKGVSMRRFLPLFAALSLAVAAGYGYLAVWFASVPPARFCAAIASSWACVFFMAIMNKRTPYGDKLLERILGFREFIDKAERDKLERLFEADPQYFYGILPWAIVMGLSAKWAAHFEGMALEAPAWYVGSRPDRFSARDFERSLGRSLGSMNASMSSAPRASSSSSGGRSGSSSSGGFSGGGSGGGGGRSW